MTRKWSAPFVIPFFVVLVAGFAFAGSSPGAAQSSSPTTAPPKTAPPGTSVDNLEAPVELLDQPASPGSERSFDTTVLPVPVTIGGPTVSVPSEKAVNFIFSGRAGQTVSIQANRAWNIEDPNGSSPGLYGNTLRLLESGQYLVHLEQALLPPATLRIIEVSSTPVIVRGVVGQAVVFSSTELREQYARVPVRGGVRYQLEALPGQKASFCAFDWTKMGQELECVNSPEVGQVSRSGPFVTTSDQELVIIPSVTAGMSAAQPTVTVIELPSDVLIDPIANPITELNPEVLQRAVIPFWGTPAERAIVSSPEAAQVAKWGQPWIDKEASGGTTAGTTTGSVKVYATPVSFNPKNPPFIAWERSTTATRFGVYRGQDIAVAVPPSGQPVSVKNRPWFAAVGSLKVEPGARYVLQITGPALRPVSLGLRDPAGKLTSNFAPWQWSEDGAQQRAVTSFTADRGGLWAIEVRPGGNGVRDVSISLLRVGGGGSFEGAVDVDDVLKVGDETDVQLSPNEFARFTLKLENSTPQIIQPEVLKYRNKTFQPSAVDMSLWDSTGRLVWSNNRTVDEEVLSGRLGTERDLTERFATVANADNYTLIIDPLSNVSGRFRVSVKSTPVISDVKLGDGAIPVLLSGTETGVVEVSTPTRYRVEAATACLDVSSLAEWGENSQGCIADGESISLPVGVHRFRFPRKVVGAARFAPFTGAADAYRTVNATLGIPVSIPVGGSYARVRFSAPAGARLVLERSLASAIVVEPDGSLRDINGTFVTAAAGVYELRIAQPQNGSQAEGTIRLAPVEVASTSLQVGAKKPSVYTLALGTRLEARVVVPKPLRLNPSGVAFEFFAEPGSAIQFAYAYDDKGRRFSNGSEEAGVELPAGSYRFVFVGTGSFRIRLLRL